MFKRLLFVILVVSGAWFAYWFVGASAAKSGFTAWFDTRASEGWLAEVEDISVKGFPNRFDTTFTNVALADPDTGVAWELPFFQLFALTYRPNHLIAVWPNSHTLAFPDQKVTVASTDMKASLVLAGDTSLPLERSNLAIEGLALTSTADWTLTADALRLAAHRQGEGENTYRLALTAEGLAPPAAQTLPKAKGLPRTLKTVQADITAGFDRPWDRLALEQARPKPTWIDVKLAQITWGDLDLNAAGRVTVDPAGIPNGDITIRATNWREIIALARETEQLPDGVLDGISQGLELLSGISGNPKTLDIPLTFKRGATWLGPVPIGPAPQLVIR